MNSKLHEYWPFERLETFAGYSTRLSSVDGAITGLIVVIPNGEGRGVPCRVVSQKEI